MLEVKKVLFMVGILVGLLSNGFADTEIEQKRAEKVDNFKRNIENIASRVESYILNTADLTPTRGEIQEYFNLDYTFWNNFEGESCAVDASKVCRDNINGGVTLNIDTTKSSITLGNTLGVNPNKFVVETYLKNKNNLMSIDSSNYNTTFIMTPVTKRFIQKVQEISNNSDIIITTDPSTVSTLLPSSTSLYVPDGNGAFDVYRLKDGSWVKAGSNEISTQTYTEVLTKEELNSTPCVKGDTVIVMDEVNQRGIEYYCTSEGKWVQKVDTIQTEITSESQLPASCKKGDTAILVDDNNVRQTFYCTEDGVWLKNKIGIETKKFYYNEDMDTAISNFLRDHPNCNDGEVAIVDNTGYRNKLSGVIDHDTFKRKYLKRTLFGTYCGPINTYLLMEGKEFCQSGILLCRFLNKCCSPFAYYGFYGIETTNFRRLGEITFLCLNNSWEQIGTVTKSCIANIGYRFDVVTCNTYGCRSRER